MQIIWGCNFSLLKGDFVSLEVLKLLALWHQVFCLGDGSGSWREWPEPHTVTAQPWLNRCVSPCCLGTLSKWKVEQLLCPKRALGEAAVDQCHSAQAVSGYAQLMFACGE